MSPSLVKHLSAESLRVYQICSLQLLILGAAPSDPVNHIFRDLETAAVLGVVSEIISTFYGQ